MGFNVVGRVACHTDLNQKGAFAEYAAVDARTAAKIPRDIDCCQAASILCAGMTAYQAMIQKLNHEQKNTILIHGCRSRRRRWFCHSIG